jgi:hypothetical protein
MASCLPIRGRPKGRPYALKDFLRDPCEAVSL